MKKQLDLEPFVLAAVWWVIPLAAQTTPEGCSHQPRSAGTDSDLGGRECCFLEFHLHCGAVAGLELRPAAPTGPTDPSQRFQALGPVSGVQAVTNHPSSLAVDLGSLSNLSV